MRRIRLMRKREERHHDDLCHCPARCTRRSHGDRHADHVGARRRRHQRHPARSESVARDDYTKDLHGLRQLLHAGAACLLPRRRYHGEGRPLEAARLVRGLARRLDLGRHLARLPRGVRILCRDLRLLGRDDGGDRRHHVPRDGKARLSEGLLCCGAGDRRNARHRHPAVHRVRHLRQHYEHLRCETTDGGHHPGCDLRCLPLPLRLLQGEEM